MIEIRHLSPALESAFRAFLADIDTDRIRKDFSPHPFTPEEARRLCAYRGSDEYYVIVGDGAVIGYGMLRGWDEGFANPSLGICIHPSHHGKHLGKMLMLYLVAAARVRGAPEIILKVRKGNEIAKRLYEEVGFEMEELDGDYWRGRLPLGAATRKKSA